MNNYLTKYSSLIFLTLLTLVYAYFNFHELLFLRPQSIHQWRQCDNLSLALNYFQYNLPFLSPKIHHLYGNNGNAMGEFPIFYYLSAQLYKLFGSKEFILRLLHLITFSIGLLFVKKIIYLLTKELLFSIITPFILLSSTIIVYYSNNFISDLPSLGLSFISSFYFLKYYKENTLKHLLIAITIITFAGLIKTTSLLTLPIFGILLLTRKNNRNFKISVILAIPLIIILLWILYAKQYNITNESTYFMLKIMPVWDSSSDFIFNVWNRLSSNWGWKNEIYPSLILYSSLISLLVFFVIKFKFELKMVVLSFFLLICMYSLLFYPQFYHHDYYLIHIIPYMIIPFISIIWWLGKQLKRNYLSSLIMIVLSIYGIKHANEHLEKRYKLNTGFSHYNNITNQLRELGITPKSKVINISDNTCCVSLYLMNQQGWTNLHMKEGDKRQYIIDKKHTEWNTPSYISNEINQRISKGAEYLFINKKDENINFIPNRYLKSKIFENSDLSIFKIQ